VRAGWNISRLRDRRNQVSDKVQDYDIEKQRAGLQFGIQQGREGRDFGIQQGREGSDFGQNREKTVKEHLLDVEQHRYELGMQQLELDIKHNQALEDSTTNLERLAQDTAIGRQELANKKSDLTQDTQMTRNKMDFDESEKRRSQNLNELGFGKNLADNIPGPDLQNLMKSNPDIAKWVSGSFAQRGMPMPNMNPAGNSGAFNVGKGVGNFLTDLTNPLNPLVPVPFKIPAAALGWLKNMFGFDTGGTVDQDMIAKIHKGEFIINPNSPNKSFQKELWLSVGKQMGTLPSYDTGGVAGGGSDWNHATITANKAQHATITANGWNADGTKKPDNTASLADTNSGSGPAPAQDDYAARFAAFANSLTHASNAEANQASLSSGAAFGGAGLVGANGTRGVNQHGNPYASATPGSYLSLLQQQQNQAATPPPPPAPIQTQPIQMPGGGQPPAPVYNLQFGGHDFSGSSFPPELQQTLQQMEQRHAAEIRNAISQMQSANLRSQYNTINQGWR
jgi:hypothetical protein